jgi:small subunit ribosomal protein S12
MVRKGRKVKPSRSKSPKLRANPQLRGIVMKTMTIDPKKPNSAKRHCARVRLSNGLEVTCYVPGRGMDIQEHNVVLVRGGRTPDLPGVKYKIVRGTRDCGGVMPEHGGVARKNSRSIYGIKK